MRLPAEYEEDRMKDDSVYYDSYKEERDLVLEYNQVDLSDARITNVMGIGVDNITRQQAVVRIMEMIKTGGVYHIIPLNPYKIIRFKANADLRLIAGAADMRLPSGAGIQWAAKMLKTPIRERIDILSLIMDVVRISEIKEFSIFLVGGRPEITERAFFNIRKSFPKIRIVGRHGGYFSEDREKSVIEAMRKSEANIVFVGLGFPREERKFTAHATLARVKESDPSLFKALDQLRGKTYGSCTVSGMKLKESTLTPRGPIYKDLLEVAW